MLVRNLDEICGTEREVSGKTWTSRRLLLADDRMGFSMHDTIIHAGTETEMHYQNHLEAVYCVRGEGRIRDLKTGVEHQIKPGTIYALDQHDHHVLFATSELQLVCVFNPPVVGPETHDENGVYPLMTVANS